MTFTTLPSRVQVLPPCHTNETMTSPLPSVRPGWNVDMFDCCGTSGVLGGTVGVVTSLELPCRSTVCHAWVFWVEENTVSTCLFAPVVCVACLPPPLSWRRLGNTAIIQTCASTGSQPWWPGSMYVHANGRCCCGHTVDYGVRRCWDLRRPPVPCAMTRARVLQCCGDAGMYVTLCTPCAAGDVAERLRPQS